MRRRLVCSDFFSPAAIGFTCPNFRLVAQLSAHGDLVDISSFNDDQPPTRRPPQGGQPIEIQTASQHRSIIAQPVLASGTRFVDDSSHPLSQHVENLQPHQSGLGQGITEYHTAIRRIGIGRRQREGVRPHPIGIRDRRRRSARDSGTVEIDPVDIVQTGVALISFGDDKQLVRTTRVLNRSAHVDITLPFARARNIETKQQRTGLCVHTPKPRENSANRCRAN